MSRFIDLPQDLFVSILKFLPDQSDRLNLTATCKSLGSAITPHVWRNITLRDTSLTDYLGGAISSKQAVEYDTAGKELARRHFGIFDSSLQSSIYQGRILPCMPGQETPANSTNVSVSFLLDIERGLIRPDILWSVKAFDLSVNTKYSGVSIYENLPEIVESVLLHSKEDDHSSSYQFDYACNKILCPAVLPNLETLTVRYTLCYNASSQTILSATRNIDQVCQRYINNLNIDLLDWSLKSLLDNLTNLPNLSACLRSLNAPKVERDLEAVNINGDLPKLSHLSLGHYSSLLMTENVVAQPLNNAPLTSFICQLKSLVTLQVLGSPGQLDTFLIPPSVKTLDFPPAALLENTENIAYMADPVSKISLAHRLSNITSLCLRLDSSSLTLLPQFPSLIPVHNLDTLTILLQDSGPLISHSEILNFYAAILSANPELSILSIDAACPQTLDIIAENCKKLERLSFHRPILDTPDSTLNEALGHIGKIATLQSLVLSVLGPQIEFNSIARISSECRALYRFAILQETSRQYKSCDSAPGAISIVSTRSNSCSDDLFSSSTDGSSSPESTLGDLDDDSHNLLQDMHLIEEGLKAISNFNFEDIEINDHIDYDDLNVELDNADMTILNSLDFGGHMVHPGAELPDPLGLARGDAEVNTPTSAAEPEICILEGFSEEQKKGFVILDQFKDISSRSLSSSQNSFYTFIGCDINYIRAM